MSTRRSTSKQPLARSGPSPVLTALVGLARWETLLAVLLAAIIAWGAERSPFFLDGNNFYVATSTFMERALMALPMTLLIVSGEIDLSVASILGLSSAVLGDAWKADLPLWLCIVLALGTGAAAGLFNGLLVTVAGLPSLVVTLGTLGLFRGMAYIVLGPKPVSNYPPGFADLGFGKIPGSVIPWSLLVFLVLLAVAVFVLHRSWIGRQIYAAGLNKEAARFSAVQVDRIKLGLYVASGTVAALAGVVYASRVASSRADNAVGFELDVIAAVLLGGVSIFGGRGNLLGVVLSLAVVAALRDALAITNVGAEVQGISVGGLLIFSVLGPNLVRRVPWSALGFRTASRRAPAPEIPVPRSDPAD